MTKLAKVIRKGELTRTQCDQKQPCGHCSKRFPQPDCVYRTLRCQKSHSLSSLTNRSESNIPNFKDAPEVQSPLGLLQAQEYGTPSAQVLYSSGKKRNNKHTNDSSSYINAEAQQDLIHSEPELGQPSLAIETLDKFNAEDYQQLLTTMVSQISSAVLSGSAVSEVPFLEKSRGRKNRSSQLFQPTLSGDEESGQVVRPFNQRLQQRHALSPPGNFSISSVDPLHYLGITATARSAELLQACK